MIYQLDTRKTCDHLLIKHLDIELLHHCYLTGIAEGDADIIFDDQPCLYPGFVHRKLMKEEMILLCRADHPRLGSTISADQFCQETHAILSTNARISIDRQLQLERQFPDLNIGYTGFSYTGLFSVVANTDLICLAPLLVYNTLQKAFNIRSVQLTFDPEIKSTNLYMSWRESLNEQLGLTDFYQVLLKIFN